MPQDSSGAARTAPASTKDYPLRRKARELTLAQAREVIEAADFAVLSTCDLEGNPYGVPVSPVLEDDHLYFHSTGRPGGRKADNLAMNPRASLVFVGKATTLPQWYSIDFASAVVTGTVEPVESEEEKAHAFALLLERYAPLNGEERNRVQMEVRGPMAMAWKVKIERITGKARGASKWVAGRSLGEVQDMGPSAWLVGVPE